MTLQSLWEVPKNKLCFWWHPYAAFSCSSGISNFVLRFHANTLIKEWRGAFIDSKVKFKVVILEIFQCVMDVKFAFKKYVLSYGFKAYFLKSLDFTELCIQILGSKISGWVMDSKVLKNHSKITIPERCQKTLVLQKKSTYPREVTLRASFHVYFIFDLQIRMTNHKKSKCRIIQRKWKCT